MSISNNLGFCMEGTSNALCRLTRVCEKNPEIGDMVYYCDKSDSPCEKKVFRKGQIMSVSRDGNVHVVAVGQSGKGAVNLSRDNWYHC